ncbi:MAG TPA: cytochrome P450 [Polyangium sp.]|nr:cytochrome P450 [Polyangium sp.]
MEAGKRSIRLPVDIGSQEFSENRFEIYRWLHENAPVHKGKASVLTMYLVSRYDDCATLLKDGRLIRNRSNAMGKSWWSFLIPKTVNLILSSMINQDDPQHKRLRRLVHKAFTPRAVEQMTERIHTFTSELLDKLETEREIDLIQSYALPIPVTVISWLLGIEAHEVPEFSKTVRATSQDFSGFGMVQSLLYDMPKSVAFLRGLIGRKRKSPGDDILTALIHAEEEGDSLTEDELISTTMLLIIAGHETTVHLITHAIVTLLEHPDELRKLQENPDLIDSTIEEVIRFVGPVHTTETNYAREDITLHGVTIPKGAIVAPLLGAANRDPAAFDKPDVFDIARSPNHHLGFGQGVHYCLGAPLARLEAKIAVRLLLQRFSRLRLPVKSRSLEVQRMPLMYRYKRVPIILSR